MPVADYLLNKKRKEILALETRHNVSISIEGSPGMVPGDSELTCEQQP
jgi:hypothetical protein